MDAVNDHARQVNRQLDSNESLPWQQEAIVRHSQRLLKSFQHWTGTSLMDELETPEATAQALFEAPFVIVSHGTEADPVFNYGNRTALALWELDWQQFICTPSRQTAEQIEQSERDQLLKQVSEHGFISSYRGTRISNSGRRFWIEDVVVWDVLDEQNQRCGQAATFSHWTFIS